MSIENECQQQSELLKTVIDKTLKKAKAKGATETEVWANFGAGFNVEVRLQEVDTVEYHRDKGVSIVVYFGKQKGSASTADLSDDSIEAAVNAACQIAKYTEEDLCAGLADEDKMAVDIEDCDLFHPWNITPEDAISIAKKCEKKALDFDSRLTNADGTNVSTSNGVTAYGNSHGFMGSYNASSHSLSCMMIAQENDLMQRNYDFTFSRVPEKLWSPEEVGEQAAQKTIARLGARKIQTQEVPIIFHATVAKGLISYLLSAVSGANLYRKSSFLCDSLGENLFPSFVQIKESPFIKQGNGSAPFDGEGVKPQEHSIVENGKLESYILSSYAARKLNMQTTGNAGGVHNILVSPSGPSFEECVSSIKKGLLVTELMGQGINISTGDYSRGASGFWIENGEIAFPVEGVSIAGNLKNMYQDFLHIADDIDMRSNIQTGSIIINKMMIAGE